MSTEEKYPVYNTMQEVIEAFKAKSEEFSKEVEAYTSKGNKSANRRARQSSLALRDLLKQFKALSMEDEKSE